MIREALSITSGMLAHALMHCAPVRWLRVRVINMRLQLICREIVDTCDDIADAKHDSEVLGMQHRFVESNNRWLDAEVLTSFYADMCNERDRLRVLRDELRSYPLTDFQPTERKTL